VAKFHAEFEKIHPFSDGNGRTGRLVMNFELMKEGYPICIIKNEDRLEYYNSLNEAQANNNYDEIVKFVEENLEKIVEYKPDLVVVSSMMLKNVESIKKLEQTMIMVSHDSYVAAYADKVYFLKDGDIISNLSFDRDNVDIDLSNRVDLIQRELLKINI